MKTLLAYFNLLAWFSFVMIVAACKQDPDPEPELPMGDTFADVIALGEDFAPYPEARTSDTTSVQEPITTDTENQDSTGTPVKHRWICTTKTVKVEDGNSEFPLFNTSADVIFPGNLLQGKTLANATPSPIVVKRAGGTVSYDLNNGNLSSAFTVNEVKKSTIQNAMNNIIASAGSVLPANFNLEIVQVQSQQQLALEMGMNVSTFVTKVGASLSYNKQQEYNSFLVKLKQSYYTMSFDLPTSIDEIFHESVTPEQLSTYVQPDNPATFISSVTYGRIFYLLIESTSSSQDMEAKLDISYGKFGNKVSGEVNVESFNSMENVKIKAIAYGGDVNGSFSLVGETSIAKVVEKLEESTDIRAGLPLSYVVKSVERPDQTVGVKLATEYDVTDCELRGVLPPQGYLELVDLFDDGIGAMAYVSNSNIIVYNKAGTKYAWFHANLGEVRGTYDIDDPNGPMGVSSLESVGAAARLTSNEIYLFNQTGLKFEVFNYGVLPIPGHNAPTGPIGDFTKNPDGTNKKYFVNSFFSQSGSFPFVGRGFAACADVGSDKIQYFGKPGDQFAIHKPSNNTWTNPQANENWFPVGNSRLFEKVGASCHVLFGGSVVRWLYVNEAGDELMEMHPAPNRKIEGPWVIN